MEEIKRVVCDSASMFISDAIAPPIHSFVLRVSPSLVSFSFDIDLDRSSSEYSGPGLKTFELSHEELKRLPHEIVAQCRGMSNTDEKLSKILPLRDATDRLTPDSIHIKDDGTCEVLEIKTTRSSHGLDKVFSEARNKYMQALEARSKNVDITFMIIVVCPTGVYTNIVLESSDVDVMVRHFLFALYVQDQAKQQGWDPNSEFEEEATFRTLLSRIPLDANKVNCRGENEFLHINTSLVEDWDHIGRISVERVLDINLSGARDEWKNRVNIKPDTPEENIAIFDARYNKLREKNLSLDPKSRKSTIIHHPFVLLSQQSPYEPEWIRVEIPRLSPGRSSPYAKLWTEALLACSTTREHFETILSAQDEKQIKDKGFWKAPLSSVSKSKRFTIKVPMDFETRKEIAERGVQAKFESRRIDLKEEVAESRRPFSLDTETDDIELSVGSARNWLGSVSFEPSFVDRRIEKLVNEALALSGDDGNAPNERFVKAFASTRVGRAAALLNEVLAEVNIARLKNVGKDCFVLKRLPNYQVYVLIKPTATDKQIFYSLLIPKAHYIDHLSLAEHLIEAGNCYATPFVSVDRHKISHLLYCDAKLASLYAFWCHQFAILPENLFSQDVRVCSHFWLSALIFLEDKEKTSTALQLIRYAYMEVVKGDILRPDPGKIFQKMDHIIRSRLLVFCIKRIYSSFREMLYTPPVILSKAAFDTTHESEDRVGRLISWVDSFPVKNFEIALNLSYLGVLHNKEEGDLIHGYLKIFDKIIDQERKLYDSPRVEELTKSVKLGAGDLRDHEFSAVAVKSFAEATKSFIDKKHGDYDSWAQSALSHALLRKTWGDLATSKASGPEYPDEAPLEDDADEAKDFNSLMNKWRGSKLQTKPSPSQKCVENIFSLVTDLNPSETCPFKYLPEILEDLEGKGGMTMKLFKKLQIGGTREIFILPIKARLVVHFLETICRTICDELPCEMLTKGDQKVVRSDMHFRRKKEVCGHAMSVTVINSDDAATWAQRFVMPVFGVMLRILVPEPFFNPCMRILNLITSKRLTLPHELLRLFQCYKDTKSYNENMNLLKTEYLQVNYNKPRILVSAGSNLMSNRSNMMQGILHYTSSLLHSCFITSFSAYVEQKISKMLIYKTFNRAVCTGKVSSDDSSLLISASLKNDQPSQAEIRAAQLLLSPFCVLKGYCYPLFCAKQSLEKSTVCNTNLIEEFNSLWYFRNTLLTPSIKFVAASIRTHVTDKFELRQNVMSGLRSQVLENSGSIFLTSVVMSCQARAHYMSLGVISNPIFPFYASNLSKAPHPALGFFLMEHHKTCGMMGPKYNLYNAVTRNPKCAKLTKRMISSAMMSLQDQESGFTSVSVTQGSKTRYYRMLNRMNTEMDSVLEYYDNNPEYLYDRPRTTEQIKQNISLKATTPSLANSFEFLTDSKQHAASSYVLQSPCVTMKLRHIGGISAEGVVEAETSTVKLSLAGLVAQTREEIEKTTCTTLSNEEMNLIFPNRNLYEKVRKLAIESNKLPQNISLRERKSYLNVSVPKFGVIFLSNPVDAAKMKWFGLQSKYSSYELSQTWIVLTSLFDWLKETYGETLIHSPLGSSVAIYQFLRSLPTSSSSFRILAPANKRTTVYDSIREIVTKSQWPGIILGALPTAKPCTGPYSSSSSSVQVEESAGRGPPASDQIRITTSGLTPPKKQPAVLKDDRLSIFVSDPPCHAVARASRIATALFFEDSLPDNARQKMVVAGTRHRIKRVKRIFLEEEDIVPKEIAEDQTSFNQLPSTEATLAIFQLVLKHGIKNISTILTCAKKGLVGSYVKRASFEPSVGKYVGHAIFRGTYNAVPFELHSFNEESTALVLRKRTHLVKVLEGFPRVVRDMRCGFDPELQNVRRAIRSHYNSRKYSVAAPKVQEYLNILTAQTFTAWGPKRVALIIDPGMLVSRDAGIQVTFEHEDGVLRLRDEQALKIQTNLKRGHVVLSYKPTKPRDLATDISYKPFSMSVATYPDKLKVDPYDLFVADKPVNPEFLVILMHSSMSNKPNSYMHHFPGLQDYLRDTLRARAERTADVLPASVLIYHKLSGRPLEDEAGFVLEQDTGLDIDRPIAEGFFDIPVGDGDFDFEDFEDYIETSLDEDSRSLNVSLCDPAEIDPKEGKITWDEALDDQNTLETAFYDYRPMLTEEFTKDAKRRSRVWDKFIDELKHNSSVEVRNRAFRGEFNKGCSPYIEAVAKLFGGTKPEEDAQKREELLSPY
nr:MAG: RNA-dependent RNA polymerase [Spider peribunya-like virus]